jgi:hypothetical protein
VSIADAIDPQALGTLVGLLLAVGWMKLADAIGAIRDRRARRRWSAEWRARRELRMRDPNHITEAEQDVRHYFGKEFADKCRRRHLAELDRTAP